MYTYPAAFDRARAQELVGLVDQAYNQLNQGTAWVSPAGYTILATLTSREYWKLPGPVSGLLQHLLPPVPFGFVARKDTSGDIYVIIRGTVTPLEWFDDFTAQPVDFRPNGAAWGRVTKGFGTLYADLGPQIVAALGALGAPPLPSIYVSGHSLGASLAHLAAAGIFAQFNVRPVSYTFCGPRAGDPAFAQAFAASGLITWRIYNTEDIVPTVPPAAVLVTTPNMGMHAIAPISQALSTLVQHSVIGYQHIGYPIAATFHTDTVADNHNQDRLMNEVNT